MNTPREKKTESYSASKIEFLDMPNCSRCEDHRKREDEVFKQLEFLESHVADKTEASLQKCEALEDEIKGTRRMQDADRKRSEVSIRELRGELDFNKQTVEDFNSRLDATHRLLQDHSREAKGKLSLSQIKLLSVCCSRLSH